MKFTILISLLLAFCFVAQAQQPTTSKLAVGFEVDNERLDFPEVYRDAALVLFEGYKPAFKAAIEQNFRGKNFKKNYLISSALLARQAPFGPQYVATFIRDLSTSELPKEVNRFQLSLETNLPAAAAASVQKALQEMEIEEPTTKL